MKELEKGGFRMKKWLTSGHSKMQQLHGNEDQHTVQLLTGARMSNSETEKILGFSGIPKKINSHIL